MYASCNLLVLENDSHLASRIWETPGLAECIVKWLPPNEVACCIRLANRAAAALFNQKAYTTVHLSQPCPHDAFFRYWAGDPEAMRSLTLKQRRQLVCLVAASGDLTNLEVAIEAAGCVPTGAVMEAAAAAGHLAVCERLRKRGCPWGGALSAAARAGHWALCDWMLSAGCPCTEASVCVALRGGNEALFLHLQDRRRRTVAGCAAALRPDGVLAAAAEGLPLADLQRYHAGIVSADLDAAKYDPAVAAAAAASPTPDWQAKVEWLAACGHRALSADALARLAALPDAVDRLTWLRRRGFLADRDAMRRAAAACGPSAGPFMQLLLDCIGIGERMGDNRDCLQRLARAAGEFGHLASLQLLQAAGELADPEAGVGVAEAAARGGQLAVLRWAVEVLLVGPGSGDAAAAAGPRLAAAALESGSLEVVSWLRDQQAVSFRGVGLSAAVGAGCWQSLQWLLEHGGVARNREQLYFEAALNGDLSTLRWLHLRLALPQRPSADDFTRCVTEGVSLPVLRWLAEAGGWPVDWEAASAAAAARVQWWANFACGGAKGEREEAERVLGWVRGEKGRRRGTALPPLPPPQQAPAPTALLASALLAVH